MKKSGVITVVAILAVVGALFIAPVRSFAVDAMDVFRVSDQSVINISMQDLTEMAQNVQGLISVHKQQEHDAPAGAGTTDGAYCPDKDKQKEAALAQQYTKMLSSAADFKAFSFKLPAYFKGQTPTITEIDPPAQTVTIDAAAMNKALAELQSPVTVPDNLNGRKMTVKPGPMVVAAYGDAVCFAAKKPSVELPGQMEAVITQIVTTLPLLPADIRSQLATIDLFDKNIYLPNVEGVTRTAALGGNTGYIYAVNDITALGDNLLATFQSGQQPAGAKEADPAQILQKYAGYEVILWVNNGILYGVAGKYTDDQLAAIARTMR